MKYEFEQDPYKAAWRFIRYDDNEIFNYTDEDFDRQAREIREAGFTHLMTFSDTHFRWSFRSEFERLTEVLRKQVAACHKYGMWVVEHHSANLSYYYEPHEYYKLEKRFDLKLWPHLINDMNHDTTYRGVRFGDMLQVSGKTGKPFRSFYNSYIMCHNNPDYIRFYLDYLETLYGTGIDGIMTDDIQFISEPLDPNSDEDYDVNSCTCIHCREQFKAEYGCELPPAGDEWLKFVNDRSNPVFIKWRRFRFDSSRRFYEAVVEHYHKLGHQKMFRPNYVATVTAWASPWGNAYETLPEQDWAFVEHCCGIIRYSWPEYCFESRHCNMVTRQRQIPKMSLYYPTEIDAQRLSWALSLYSGHRYFGDPKNEGIFPDQERFHVFEEAHFDSLFKSEENLRLAFFDSPVNREIDWNYNKVTRSLFNSWGQACIHNNVPWTMVNSLHLEELQNYDVVVVPGTAFLSDDELKTFCDFAANGGTLVWVSGGGAYRLPSTEKRPEVELLQALKIAAMPGHLQSAAIGKGKLVFVEFDRMAGYYNRRCRVKDNSDRDAFDCSEPTRWRVPTEGEWQQYKDIAAFLNGLLPGGPDLEVKPEIRDLLVSSFYQPHTGVISVRVCNAVDTMEVEKQGGFGEKDPIPFPVIDQEIQVKIRRPAGSEGKKFTSAELYREGHESLTCNLVNVDENYIEISFPGKLLKEFILVEIN